MNMKLLQLVSQLQHINNAIKRSKASVLFMHHPRWDRVVVSAHAWEVVVIYTPDDAIYTTILRIQKTGERYDVSAIEQEFLDKCNELDCKIP